MGENLRIAEETDFNFDETSRLACEAFGKDIEALSAERFRWSYKQAYEQVFVLSVFVDEQKVGQFGIAISHINVGQERHKAAELIDLFVSHEHRRRAVIGGLYNGLKDYFAQNGIHHVFAYPNEKARPLNKAYFELNQFSVLPMHIGMRRLFSTLRKPSGFQVYDDASDFFDVYADAFKYGLVDWDRDQLKKRLSNPVHTYMCAGDGNIGIIGSPRDIRGLPVLLVCGTYCNDPSRYSSRKAAAILSSMCAHAGVRFYLYGGWNQSIPSFPGLRVPKFLNGEKFMIQSNFIEQPGGVAKLELIDIDYG